MLLLQEIGPKTDFGSSGDVLKSSKQRNQVQKQVQEAKTEKSMEKGKSARTECQTARADFARAKISSLRLGCSREQEFWKNQKRPGGSQSARADFINSGIVRASVQRRFESFLGYFLRSIKRKEKPAARVKLSLHKIKRKP